MSYAIDELVKMANERLSGSLHFKPHIDKPDEAAVPFRGMWVAWQFSMEELAALMGLDERKRLRGLLRQCKTALWHCLNYIDGVNSPDYHKARESAYEAMSALRAELEAK